VDSFSNSELDRSGWWTFVRRRTIGRGADVFLSWGGRVLGYLDFCVIIWIKRAIRGRFCYQSLGADIFGGGAAAGRWRGDAARGFGR
jgi:hypothetical protein